MTGINEERLINKRELLRLVPLSYSTVWQLMRRGEFPLSITVSGRVFWKWREVREFLDNLPRSKYLGIEDLASRAGDDR
ncbi:MAG: AlpA family phage regulatory protein [Alphaproteobacteria bacterium]|nr:AlpA family phage regulatory protein [Alphaproteobacteria bacterium]